MRKSAAGTAAGERAGKPAENKLRPGRPLWSGQESPLKIHSEVRTWRSAPWWKGAQFDIVAGRVDLKKNKNRNGFTSSSLARSVARPGGDRLGSPNACRPCRLFDPLRTRFRSRRIART